jgi:hypothetical protein
MHTISADLFSAYLNCRTKCWLRAVNHSEAGNAYSDWIEAENDSYRTSGSERLICDLARHEFAQLPHMWSINLARCHFSPLFAISGQRWMGVF